MDPIECAVRGDTTFFKEVATPDDLHKTDEAGNSVLSLAAQANHLACCKEIYKRCPSLLYHQSNLKETVLHHAAWRGNPELIKFLIDAAAKTPTKNREGQYVYDEKMLLRMLDDYGDSGLHKTVLNNKYEAAELLINADPDFDYGVNHTREKTMLMTALDLSYNTVDESREKIRRLLLEKQPNSSKIRSGANKGTALHHATHQGDLRAIKDILEFCPECSELVDSQGRNFLHLAAKYGHVEVVKYVLGSDFHGNMCILNAQDNDGNTPLHIAALGDDQNRAHCAVCLRCDSRVNKLTVNKKLQKVSDALRAQARVHDVRDGVNEKKLKNQIAFDVVVCTLICTVSYTLGITVPGGYIPDGVNQGSAILSKKTAFQVFVISNGLAFHLSICAMISHLCTRYQRRKERVYLLVKLATIFIMIATFSIEVAFCSASYAVLSVTNWLPVAACAPGFIFFFFMFLENAKGIAIS